MGAAAKYAGLIAGWLVVAAWAIWHGPFNGASLLVELTLAALAVRLWRKAFPSPHPPLCPHCRGDLPRSLTDTTPHRGDGI